MWLSSKGRDLRTRAGSLIGTVLIANPSRLASYPACQHQWFGQVGIERSNILLHNMQTHNKVAHIHWIHTRDRPILNFLGRYR